MKRYEERFFPVNGLVNHSSKNNNLETVKKNNYIKGNNICKNQVFQLIIKECRESFGAVNITKKQISSMLNIKKAFPYKALIILMAIYNLLKRDSDIVFDIEIQELVKIC